MKKITQWTLICMLAGGSPAAVAERLGLEFSLHKHRGAQPGPTLLVIGGIQGDEPGGFNAASLLVTDYRITRGQVWVVPNLNFESIIKRSRGVYGDMNRKFLNLRRADPEYAQVERIKSIILDPQVDIIINLHDGSGFYSPRYINTRINPNRWGQSIIIDQTQVSNIAHGNLQMIAQWVVDDVNAKIKTDYPYHIKNTNTRDGNVEMEKTLTYFAIRHGKSAFGVESSKEYGTHQRAHFHLQVAEAFMRYLGIDYERIFELNPQQVKNRIDGNVQLALYDRRIFLDMADARSRLGYMPLKKDAPLDFIPSNPLIAVVSHNENYNIRYGNRNVTYLHPQYMEYDDSLRQLSMTIDGLSKPVNLGEVVHVHDEFYVPIHEGYRVNIIGFTRAGVDDDSGFRVNYSQLLRHYSVDKAGKTFRVEVYRGDKFCGMVLVRFIDKSRADMSSLKSEAFAKVGGH